MPHCGKQRYKRKRPHSRIGYSPESYRSYCGKHTVKQYINDYICHDIYNL